MPQRTSTLDFAELEGRALRLEGERRLEEARDAFDAALSINADSQTCAEGRARVALALGEGDSVGHCLRALAFHNCSPERQLRMISTAAVELGSAAFPLFEDFLGRNPANPAGHEAFSELRAEWGAGDRFADSYISALREYPLSKPLLMSYWNTLTRAGRLSETLELMDAKRALFEGDRDFAILEVNIANHAGLVDHAGALIDRLDDGSDAQLARGQHLLQKAELPAAARLFEAVVRAQPDNVSAWCLLELAWRATCDRRHEWLIGQPGLYGSMELGLGASEVEEIAESLRALHRTRAQPIGQSLRGGTQTPGQLFIRPEPQIGMLTDALAVAIRQFVSNLPPPDARHPLLRHRNGGMAFGPSWSVRFTGTGYHAPHFHPNGILSSACYLELPDIVADTEGKPGWLEIGRPPPEMHLDLPPLACFEPRPGRLVLFPSFLFHGTRSFTGGERLTVAFDLVPVPMDSTPAPRAA